MGSAERRQRVRRTIAVVTRWLHIYLSMVSFAVVLFFAVTGLTLNHPDWFSRQRTTSLHGSLPMTLLRGTQHGGSAGAGLEDALAGALRARHHLHGTVTDYREDEAQISLSFRAPGYTADAFVDRASGGYDLTIVQGGAVAVLNDLHRGHDAGKAWGLLIDASAILLAIVSLTGLVLLWFLQRKRRTGLLVAGLAMVLAGLLAAAVVL